MTPEDLETIDADATVEEAKALLRRKQELRDRDLRARGKLPKGWGAFRAVVRKRGRPKATPGKHWPVFQVLAFTLARAQGQFKPDKELDFIVRRGGFWAFLGPAPLVAPGDTAAAARFVERIEAVRGMGSWGSSERVQLSKLLSKWRFRASGKSARFQRYGTASGYYLRPEVKS